MVEDRSYQIKLISFFYEITSWIDKGNYRCIILKSYKIMIYSCTDLNSTQFSQPLEKGDKELSNWKVARSSFM